VEERIPGEVHDEPGGKHQDEGRPEPHAAQELRPLRREVERGVGEDRDRKHAAEEGHRTEDVQEKPSAASWAAERRDRRPAPGFQTIRTRPATIATAPPKLRKSVSGSRIRALSSALG